MRGMEQSTARQLRTCDENGSGYESICEVMQIDYEDYKED